MFADPSGMTGENWRFTMDKKVIVDVVVDNAKYIAKAVVVCAGVGFSVITAASEISKGVEFFAKK